VVIKLFFGLLVLGTTAIVAVCVAVHLRFKRHLRQGQMDAAVRAVIEEATQTAAEEEAKP